MCTPKMHLCACLKMLSVARQISLCGRCQITLSGGRQMTLSGRHIILSLGRELYLSGGSQINIWRPPYNIYK